MDQLGSLFRRLTAVATASAHKPRGKTVNMDRAAVMIIRLYRPATPFDSCEYAREISGTLSCLSKSVNMTALTYSPPLSVLNRLMVVLS